MLAGRRSPRRRGRRRGVALVEFAMVIPVVFLFMFGMIELSRYVMVQQALTSAAQRGCRKAVLATTVSDDAVKSAVYDYLGGSLGITADSNVVDISVSPQNLNAVASGSSITVRVAVNTADISWVRSGFVNRSADVVLAGQSTFLRE